MSIVYIPLVVQDKQVALEESLPSPLTGRVAPEEWESTITKLNALLKKRESSWLLKLLSLSLLGNQVRRYRLSRIDQEIAEYLEKKNLALQSTGVFIHHPKERRYSGVDVSIYTYL